MMLKQLQQTVDSNQKSSNEKFKSLEKKLSSQTEIWKSEINSTLTKHLLDTENKYKRLTAKVSSINVLVEDKFEEIDRQNRLCDILIRGVPMCKNENLHQLFDKISTILKFPYEKMYLLHSIFRFKSKYAKENQIAAAPILVKFSTPVIKRAFFNQFLQHKNLKLSDIGYNSPNQIYFSDNLTKQNSNNIQKSCRNEIIENN